MGAKKVFVAATGQHVGKTSVTVGLISVLRQKGLNVGYCKPVGQEHLEVDGKFADKDAVLLASMLGLPLEPELHSPVIVGSGETRRYLENPDAASISARIRSAAETLEKMHDVVVFEGTGHPGVGSVVDHSNAKVASLIGAEAVLVCEAGIGNAIDRLHLCKSLFDSAHVPLLGTIINKMKLDKMESVRKPLTNGCQRQGIKLLGIIPYDDVMVYPRLDQIRKAVNAKVLVEGGGLKTRIRWYAIGAVVSPGTGSHTEQILLITPGDRVDELIEIIVKLRVQKSAGWTLGGVLLTDDRPISEEAAAMFETSGIPVMLTRLDTYTAAMRLHDYVAKIDADSTEKIETITRLVNLHVQLGALGL